MWAKMARNGGSVCGRVETDGCFQVWAKLARTRCPIREARWPKEWFIGELRWLGQVVQFGGQDDSGQGVPVVVSRRHGVGASSARWFVVRFCEPRGLKALRIFGESPNGGQDVGTVSKGKGWGVPSQGGPGRMGKVCWGDWWESPPPFSTQT